MDGHLAAEENLHEIQVPCLETKLQSFSVKWNAVGKGFQMFNHKKQFSIYWIKAIILHSLKPKRMMMLSRGGGRRQRQLVHCTYLCTYVRMYLCSSHLVSLSGLFEQVEKMWSELGDQHF